jgi:hypothetical protein
MHLENEMKIPNSLCAWKFFKFGIISRNNYSVFKLAEDDNLTGLQTITKKAFHMLISKRTTNYCGTICHSKISSLVELFLFLVQMLKKFEFTLFFQHTD